MFDAASVSLCGALVLTGACTSSQSNCTPQNGASSCSAAGSGGAGGTGGSGSYSGGSGGGAAKGGTGGQGGQMGAGARGGSQAAGSGGVGGGKCFAKPLFSSQMAWNQRVDAAAKDGQSDTIIAALQNRGWGNGGVMQIDFSIDVLCADATTPRRAFEPNDDFYGGECDQEAVPVPSDGHLEGESGYRCTTDGDCHLIVIAEDTDTLYEQWRVNIEGSDYQGGCLAVWQLDRTYGAALRGEQCTSADAAGLPIAPLLFDADEVAGGAVEHAVRFAIPNTHIRKSTYVRPGTHATGAASAGADGVPYGARLRLRADYPLDDLPNDAARVLARALQRYGMILADGGNIALMGQDDRSTTAKWDDLLEPRDLSDLKPRDFELVEAGERFTWTGDCVLED
jgi:hypothetical protein